MNNSGMRLQKRRHRRRRVILQTLPDAGQRHAHVDPHIAQMPNRTDPGAHQMRRRMDSAA